MSMTQSSRADRLHVVDRPGGEPAFVLMHGFPDDHHIYDRLTPLLDPRRVVTFDLPACREVRQFTTCRCDLPGYRSVLCGAFGLGAGFGEVRHACGIAEVVPHPRFGSASARGCEVRHRAALARVSVRSAAARSHQRCRHRRSGGTAMACDKRARPAPPAPSTRRWGNRPKGRSSRTRMVSGSTATPPAGSSDASHAEPVSPSGSEPAP
jgi:pimeloyl-ACP methyl ester carboxylesterase